MAFMTSETCRICKKEYCETQSSRQISDCICRDCKGKKADTIRIQHFAKLDKMTIEQRLRLLEKNQYNNSLIKIKLPYDPNAVYG